MQKCLRHGLPPGLLGVFLSEATTAPCPFATPARKNLQKSTSYTTSVGTNQSSTLRSSVDNNSSLHLMFHDINLHGYPGGPCKKKRWNTHELHHPGGRHDLREDQHAREDQKMEDQHLAVEGKMLGSKWMKSDLPSVSSISSIGLRECFGKPRHQSCRTKRVPLC